MTHALFLAHLGATLMMVGILWMVQIVQYPLFSKVDGVGFDGFHDAHMTTITFVVGPLMLVEVATAVGLLLARPGWIPSWSMWAGLALIGLVWLSTWFVQVPLHNALASGGLEVAVVDKLVATNWVRTLGWSARAGLVLWWASLAMGQATTPA